MKLLKTTQFKRNSFIYVFAIISFVILFAVILREKNVSSYHSGSFTEITDWTLIGENGVSESITLPCSISAKDVQKEYLFSAVIPPTQRANADSLRFCTSYMDIDIDLNGENVYSSHISDVASFGSSGNEFHFLDLPYSESERIVTVKIRCQIPSSFPCMLKPALWGSKTAMYVHDTIHCLPILLLGVVMFLISLTTFTLQRMLFSSLDNSSHINHFGIFTLLFSAYMLLETEFALIIINSSRLIYMAKIMLLMLYIIPLFEIALQPVQPKYRKRASTAIYLAIANFIAQFFLHFTGVMDLCTMLRYTHLVIAVGVIIIFYYVFKSGKAAARCALRLSPMIAGFLADVVLLYIGHASYHNTFWFSVGVCAYALCEFIYLIRIYFKKFHEQIESSALRAMAFTDILTGINNRNAYEEHLKMLCKSAPAHDLGCIVADVTGLKQLNDSYGHSMGDLALIETARIIKKHLPANGCCFRTGGDEFIALISGIEPSALAAFVAEIEADIALSAKANKFSFMLAIGSGLFQTADENVPDFIRRVDSLMYERKREQKKLLLIP